MTFQLACPVDEVGPSSTRRVELASTSGELVEVAIVRDAEGDFHAIGDVCTHGQVSLSDGEVVGCLVECWLHGAQFDVRTGQPVSLPATRPVPVFPVRVDSDLVFVDVDVPLSL